MLRGARRTPLTALTRLVMASGLFALASCTDGTSSATTLTSRPRWMDRTTLATTQTTSTLPASTTTTTLPPDQRPKGTGWSPPEGLTDEQIKKVGMALLKDANDGAGSRDPALYRKALMATSSDARNDVAKHQQKAVERNAEDKGALEFFSQPQRLQIGPSRISGRFVICIRDNAILTEIGTGRVVDDSPPPRKIKAVALAIGLDDTPNPVDGSRPGNYWTLLAITGTRQGELQCPTG